MSMIGKVFIHRNTEWKVVSDPINDVFGRPFVWATGVRQKRRNGWGPVSGRWKRPQVWHLEFLPKEVKP